MIVKTRWPALIPAILKAGHIPVLEHPIEEWPKDKPLPAIPVDDRLVLEVQK